MVYKQKSKKTTKKTALFISKILVALLLVLSMGVTAYADIVKAAESVNLREKPTTESKVLKLVPVGHEVEVLDTSGDWKKVKFGGITGYVKSEFLEKANTGNSSTNTGTNTGANTNASTGAQDAQKSGGQSSGGALKNGAEGDAVKELQQLMKDQGHYSGPVNGKFGPLTEEAVKGFQQKMGLTVDGIAGSETLSKLREKKAASNGGAAAFRNGDEGEGVKKIQSALKEKGFYSGPVNGKFGPMTEEALKSFQKAKGIEVDGIAGAVTQELLYAQPVQPTQSAESAKTDSSSNSSDTASSGNDGETAASTENSKAANGVELIRWVDAKDVLKIGATVRVHDVKTGISYHVKSFSNGRHADVEPVTKDDTALLKATYGGVWSWDPRPVWVTVGERTMAASINGMPHAGGVNDDNGMDGQVCLHFLGSSTHNGNKSFTQLHQNGVMEAWNAANK